MNTNQLRLEGVLFNGETPLGRAATLTFSRAGALLAGNGLASTYRIGKLKVSPRVGSATRFISLPDGRQFHCKDRPLLERLPQEEPSEGLVSWLEGRVMVALGSVCITVLLLLASYFYGLPRAAEYIAERIPMETERILGEHILNWFDNNGWFAPSHTGEKEQASIREAFRGLSERSSMEQHYLLLFRAGNAIGPNAMALPGGIIVITDSMVELTGSIDEIMAVLAHEMGHVENRHVMRQLIQSSTIGAVIATITADATSLGLTGAGLPVAITSASYSRDFEKDADEFAFSLLKAKNISPAAFAALMERLSNLSGDRQDIPFLSTHPQTEERVQRARNVSADMVGENRFNSASDAEAAEKFFGVLPCSFLMQDAKDTTVFGRSDSGETIGIGQGVIFDRSCFARFAGFRLSGGFGAEVELSMDIRNVDGSIIKTVNTVLPKSFEGGWVYFNGLDMLLWSDKEYVFTAYMSDGRSSGVNTGVYGSPLDLIEGGQGYSGRSPGTALKDWSLWSAHSYDFDIMIQ